MRAEWGTAPLRIRRSRPNGWRSSKRRRGDRWKRAFATRSFTPINRSWTTRRSGLSTRRPITAAGVRRTCRTGWVMAAFEYRQAQEIRDCFQRHGIRYLFLGKSGAILLGFPDTTQDAHLFVEKTPENGAALVGALREHGLALSED